MSLPILLSLPVSRVPWISTPSSVLTKDLPVSNSGPASGKGNHNIALCGKRQSMETDKKQDQPEKSQCSLYKCCARKAGWEGKPGLEADLNRGMNP